VDVRVQELDAGDLDRIGDIDRSERTSSLYVHEDGALRAVPVDLAIPTWDEAALARVKARLRPKLATGGVLVGALDGDRLVGAAVLAGEWMGPRADQLELAFLYVSSDWRGRGIGRRLMDHACRRAREHGAARLYVSASDTCSAIRFYLGYGCRPAEHVDAALAALVPTDIHLTCDL
jgi:ribosomal protein S18 acetylase RimI-like enzyme